MSMRTQLIPIGNSRGVRIPAAIIRECGLEGEVDLEIRGGGIYIKAIDNPRSGWEAAILKTLEEDPSAGDTDLLDEGVENDFDVNEWTW